MDKATLDARTEQFIAYLARNEIQKPWMDEQFVCDLYAADLKLGLHRGMAKVWSGKEEGPMEAAATLVAVEGWCLHCLIFLKGRKWSQLN